MATQSWAVGQDTPNRDALMVSGGSGTVITVQLVPFQCSTSGKPAPPVDAKYQPTATQLPGAAQDTPLSPPSGAPAGLGTARRVQRVPFHCSAIGSCPSESDCPTALQLSVEAHDKPKNSPTPPTGLGVGWIAQLLPSQCSARGDEMP